MNSTLTSIILGASVVLEVVLELHGTKVPAIVYLLSGFAVRHIIGGETAKDSPIVTVPLQPKIAPVEVPKP